MANPLTRLFLDPVDADRDRVARKFQFSDDYRWWGIPAAVGAVLFVLSLLALFGGGDMAKRFWYAYLVGWTFCLSISLGSLLFVMIHHITKARWGTTVRRIPELIVANFPLLAVLGVPLLVFGMHDLYHWTHHELYEVGGPEYDRIVAGKAAYLNTPFFILRIAAYFAIWTFIARKMYTLSVRQDTEPSVENTHKLRFWSGAGIPLTAVTLAFASYDLIMSLDPHWFSTMFGVYFFAGGWLSSIALITFLALLFRKAGYLELEITLEHYHDLGKFLFAFTIFWTYIAFSQYMLIWYGDLPEETRWFMDRYSNGWESVTWALILFHFLIPFLILIIRQTKRTLPVLAFMCGWILVMQFIDLFWLALPTMASEAAHTVATHGAEHGEAVMMAGTVDFEAVSHSSHAHFSWVDITMWLGMFGLFLGATLWRAGRHSLTPYNDPYFADSVRFENP